MAELKPLKSGYYLWKYLPSQAASILFLILFLGLTLAHSWRIYKYKQWFCVAFAVGGFFEVVGYGVRASAYHKTDRIMPYAAQNLLILLAPVLFAASIYMTLGRIIRSVGGERFSVIRMKWLTKLFVAGDVLSLCVQGGGGGLMATGSNAKLGQIIIIVGLFIQIVIFGFFVICAAIFQRRMKRHLLSKPPTNDNLWLQCLKMLHICSFLIAFRSMFRVIEYVMGENGYLLTHEWTMYVFDAVPMLAAMAVFFVWFPCKLKPRGTREDDGHFLVSQQRT